MGRRANWNGRTTGILPVVWIIKTTEQAYNNPKFVEDLVRDIATKLNSDDRIVAYTIESENFESIHNHSAYAYIEKDKNAD